MKINFNEAEQKLYNNFKLSSFKKNFQCEKKPDLSLSKKLLASSGAVLGAVIPSIFLVKSNKINKIDGNIFKKFVNVIKNFQLDWDFKKIVGVGVTSAIGGFLTGSLVDPENKKEKANEMVHSVNNILIPTSVAALLVNATKNLKNPILKAAVPLLGVMGAIPFSNAVSNKINSKIIDPNTPERKVEFKDCLIHVDDLINFLIVSKLPLANKIHADKMLPLIYSYVSTSVALAKKEPDLAEEQE